jgi:hypothetical protein
MADIKSEIKQNIGILSESAKGWSKELNLVSWNDKEPKYDLREWSEGVFCNRKFPGFAKNRLLSGFLEVP